jgi:hypothetical protein
MCDRLTYIGKIDTAATVDGQLKRSSDCTPGGYTQNYRYRTAHYYFIIDNIDYALIILYKLYNHFFWRKIDSVLQTFAFF